MSADTTVAGRISHSLGRAALADLLDEHGYDLGRRYLDRCLQEYQYQMRQIKEKNLRCPPTKEFLAVLVNVCRTQGYRVKCHVDADYTFEVNAENEREALCFVLGNYNSMQFTTRNTSVADDGFEISPCERNRSDPDYIKRFEQFNKTPEELALLPCPHCGGQASFDTVADVNEREYVTVICNECNPFDSRCCEADVGEESAERAAAELWNRRVGTQK